ncbi:hypothetical protein SM81_01438, partial [Klebsiella pneumoniae]
ALRWLQAQGCQQFYLNHGSLAAAN